MKKKTTQQCIKEFIVVHGDKYNYSLVDYNGDKNKVIIICQIHGEFLQTPGSHLSGRGCNFCGNNQLKDKSVFVFQSNLAHNYQYDYSKVEYLGNKKKVIIICQIHGEFSQQPSHHLNGSGCPKCGHQKVVSAITKPNDKFVIQANIKYNNKFDYGECEYINARTEVIIRCPIHGKFLQKPTDHLNQKYGCPQCSLLLADKQKGEKNYNWNPDREYVNRNSKWRMKNKTLLRNTLKSFNTNKSQHTLDLLGYSSLQLGNYIENHPNYEYTIETIERTGDKFSIDHNFPLKAFVDYSLDKEEYICIANCFENLQPMPLKENCSKGDAYNSTQFEQWLETKGVKLHCDNWL